MRAAFKGLGPALFFPPLPTCWALIAVTSHASAYTLEKATRWKQIIEECCRLEKNRGGGELLPSSSRDDDYISPSFGTYF